MQALRKLNCLNRGLLNIELTYFRSVVGTHEVSVASMQPAAHLEELSFPRLEIRDKCYYTPFLKCQNDFV